MTLALIYSGGTASRAGPSICSPEGVARLKFAGASEEIVSRACPTPSQPAQDSKNGSPDAKPAHEQPKTWKVQPTQLSILKADPPSYLEKPTLVFVAIKPSDFFNWGYGGARNTHYAFELHPVLADGRVGPDQLYGYAARSWARPFFDQIIRSIEEGNGRYEYTSATLVVSYLKKRYDGTSADHIEILAAEAGKKFDMDPLKPAAAPAKVTNAPKTGHVWPSSVSDAAFGYCMKRSSPVPVVQRKSYCGCVVTELRREFSAEDMGRVETEPSDTEWMKVATMAVQYSELICHLRTQPVDLARRYPRDVQEDYLRGCRGAKLTEKACDCRLRRIQARHPLEVFLGASDRDVEVMRAQAVAYCDAFDEKP